MRNTTRLSANISVITGIIASAAMLRIRVWINLYAITPCDIRTRRTRRAFSLFAERAAVTVNIAATAVIGIVVWVYRHRIAYNCRI